MMWTKTNKWFYRQYYKQQKQAFEQLHKAEKECKALLDSLEEEKKSHVADICRLERQKRSVESRLAYALKGQDGQQLAGENEPVAIQSGNFWNEHYKKGGTSGTGSYNRLAEFKAMVVNDFIRENNIKTTIEFGCGDGNQLSLINYECYTGVDVSEYIVERNREKYVADTTKVFFHTLTEREKYINQKYDMAISMDVIFHLLEDDIFSAYMEDLFSVAEKYVVIYSSNHEEYTRWEEFRHRNFMSYVQKNIRGWKLTSYIPNEYPYVIGEEECTSTSDFYLFERMNF